MEIKSGMDKKSIVQNIKATNDFAPFWKYSMIMVRFLGFHGVFVFGVWLRGWRSVPRVIRVLLEPLNGFVFLGFAGNADAAA